jgi:hypothetical protein
LDDGIEAKVLLDELLAHGRALSSHAKAFAIERSVSSQEWIDTIV